MRTPWLLVDLLFVAAFGIHFTMQTIGPETISFHSPRQGSASPKSMEHSRDMGQQSPQIDMTFVVDDFFQCVWTGACMRPQ
jgi:hypothetical protein